MASRASMLAYARHYGLARPPEADLQKLLDAVEILSVDDKDLVQPFQNSDTAIDQDFQKQPLQINRHAAQLLDELATERERQWQHLSPRFHSDLDFPLERRQRAVQTDFKIPVSLSEALQGLGDLFTSDTIDETSLSQHAFEGSAKAWTCEKVLLPRQTLGLLESIANPSEPETVVRLDRSSHYESYYLVAPLRPLYWHNTPTINLAACLSGISTTSDGPDLCDEEVAHLKWDGIEDGTSYVESLKKDWSRESMVVQLRPRTVLELDCPLIPRPTYRHILGKHTDRDIKRIEIEDHIDLNSSSSVVNLAEVFNIDGYEMSQEHLELSDETLHLKVPEVPSLTRRTVSGEHLANTSEMIKSVEHSWRTFVTKNVSSKDMDRRVSWTPFPGVSGPFLFEERLTGEILLQDFMQEELPDAATPFVQLSSSDTGTSPTPTANQEDSRAEQFDEDIIPDIDDLSSMPVLPDATMNSPGSERAKTDIEVLPHADILPQRPPSEGDRSEDSIYALLKRKREALEGCAQGGQNKREHFTNVDLADTYFRLRASQHPPHERSRPALTHPPPTSTMQVKEKQTPEAEAYQSICPVFLPIEEAVPTSWIISSTLLQRTTLVRALRSHFPSVTFIERELDPASEVDLVTSPSSGILVLTADQLSTLPARLAQLRHRYARVDVILRLVSSVTAEVSTALAKLASVLMGDASTRTAVTLVVSDAEEIAYLSSIAQRTLSIGVSIEADRPDDVHHGEAFLRACPLLNPAAVLVLTRSDLPLGRVLVDAAARKGLLTAARWAGDDASLDAWFSTADWRV